MSNEVINTTFNDKEVNHDYDINVESKRLAKIQQPVESLFHRFSKLVNVLVGETTIHVYYNKDNNLIYVPFGNIFSDYFDIKPDTSRISEVFSYPDIMFIKLSAANDWRNNKHNTTQVMMSLECLRKYIDSKNYSHKKEEKKVLYEAVNSMYGIRHDETSDEQEESKVPVVVPESLPLAYVIPVATQLPMEDVVPIEPVPEEEKREDENIPSPCLTNDDITKQVSDFLNHKDDIIKSKDEEIERLKEEKQALQEKVNEVMNTSVVVHATPVESVEITDDDISLAAQAYRSIETLKTSLSFDVDNLPAQIRAIFGAFSGAIGSLTNTNDFGAIKTEIYNEMVSYISKDIYAAHKEYQTKPGKVNARMLDYILDEHLYEFPVSMYRYAVNKGYKNLLYSSICKHYNVDVRNINFAIYFLRCFEKNPGNKSGVQTHIPYIDNKVDLEYARKHKK